MKKDRNFAAVATAVIASAFLLVFCLFYLLIYR